MCQELDTYYTNTVNRNVIVPADFFFQAQASASSYYIPAQSMYQELERYYNNTVNRNQNVAVDFLSQAQASASS